MNANALPIKIKRLHVDAVIPQYAKIGDSGFDLVAVEDVIVRPGETAKVPVGLAFEIPQGYELQVRPRSGVTSKTKLRVAFGTVDSGYRGEVAVMVDNIEQKTKFTSHYTLIDGSMRPATCIDAPPRGSIFIRKGDRIAQGVIAPVIRAEFAVVDELSESERGTGGFGSTGVVAEVPEHG